MEKNPTARPLGHIPKVLMVEDNDSVAEILSFILRRESFDVWHVPDGRAAELHVAERAPPDAVLLDVTLPYVDGFQLITKIRSQPGWDAVPVIMLTGNSEESDIARALACGANDYIVKPFEPKELVARLRQFLCPD